MEDAHAAELLARIQTLPKDKQAHFKLTIVSLMHCYLDDNISGALIINYLEEQRSAVIAMGMTEDDLLNALYSLTELIENGEESKVTLQ